MRQRLPAIFFKIFYGAGNVNPGIFIKKYIQDAHYFISGALMAMIMMDYSLR
jgi:hypothetical protein